MNTLTRYHVREDLLAALLQLPNVTLYEARSQLLLNLDPAFVATVPRSPVAKDDLEHIVNATLALVDPVNGRWGLAILLANALDLAEKSQAATLLGSLRRRLMPAPDQIDFTVAAALLPVPTEQYIASPCEIELPVGAGASPPTGEDLAYLRAVRQVYQEWRDDPEARFIAGPLNPRPAALVATDVIHRELPGGSGATLHFWSWCKANDHLMANQRLLILGRPGIGKTSLIRFLARRYTMGTAALLPIIVSLRTWRNPPDAPCSLVEFIQGFLQAPPDAALYPNGAALAANLPRYLADPVQQTRLVFLLDDYNRMARDNPADYNRRWQAIREFATTYQGTTIAIISRLLDYDGHLDGCQPPFPIVELNRWGPAQIREYLKRNAQPLLPLAEERWFMDLADVPVQLAQMVELLVPQDGASAAQVFDRVFKNAREVLDAFVDRLFTFSEQTGRGDQKLRDPARQLLGRFAAGLRAAKKSGSYVEVAELPGYLAADTPPPDLARLLATAIDATILDMLLDMKRVGFEAQQLEDYFATTALSDPVADVEAHLSSGQPDAAVRAVEAADTAGLLTTHAAIPT